MKKIDRQTDLQEGEVQVKVKLAALWTVVMFCYVYGDYFELYVPKKVQGLVTGDNMLDSPMKLFVASIVAVTPALMICCSVFLPAKPNRVLNLVLGTAYTALMLLVGAMSLSVWRTFYVFLALLESVLTVLIVGQAWNWAKTEAAPVQEQATAAAVTGAAVTGAATDA